MVEHGTVQKRIKAKTYAELHNISEEEIPQDVSQFLEAYQKQRNNTKPCGQPASREEVERLAWQGEPGAISWCKFAGILPLDFDPKEAQQPAPADQPAEFDKNEAARRHLIAVCCSAMGHATSRHVPWLFLWNFYWNAVPMVFFFV